MNIEFWLPLQAPETLQQVLDRFDSWGAVVQHTLFATLGEADRNDHFLAALSALEAYRVWRQKNFPHLRNPVPVFNWEVIGMERGRPWSAAEFFGPSFDIARRTVFVPRAKDDQPPLMAEPPWNKMSEFECYVDFTTRGYAQAILDPPYSLSARNGSKGFSPTIVANSFLSLCDELFGDLAAIEVVSWPYDFSDSFRPGLEWWGSYFWTVWVPQKKWIVTVIASSTD